MIADQNFNDTCFAIIYPTASATVYGRRPKFFMAEHSATAEGENRAYGPTLQSSENCQALATTNFTFTNNNILPFCMYLA